MKDLGYYRELPYQALVAEDVDDEGDRLWRAGLAEIPAVAGVGATEEEALADLRDRFEEYVLWRLEHDLDIPEPDTRR